MKRSAGIDEKRHAQEEFKLLNSKPKSRNGRKQAGEFREGAVCYMPVELWSYPHGRIIGTGSQERKCRVVLTVTCALPVTPLSSFKGGVLEIHVILYKI